MKKILVALLFGFIFSESPNSIINQNHLNRDCSDITNPNECYDMGCEWIVMYEQIENELIITEECIDSDSNDNEDDEDSYCEDLYQDECALTDGCEWISGNMPGVGYCVEEDLDNQDCDPDLACGATITCWEDGLLYPTTCGPENCDDPIGECDNGNIGCQSDDGQWYDIGSEMFMNDCEYYECTLNGWIGPFVLNNDNCSDNNVECSELNQQECTSLEECEWAFIATPNGYYETCIDADDWNGGEQGCFEGGEWFDLGQELFISNCDYLECTPNGWVGPFTLDSDDCSNDNLLCSDINNLYECYAMGCEWISGDMPGAGYCVEDDSDNQDCDPDLACGEMITCWEDGLLYPTTCGPENCDNPVGECDDDGPPECLEDCSGIEDINPDENPYETCDWIIFNFGPNNFFNECAEDCDDETMMEINEIIEVCIQCLADNNCDDAFDDNEDNCNELDENSCVENPNCNPNYNAAGSFENCEEIDDQQFGYLYGTVEYIYGDAIAFMPLAPIYIESMPSNTDMFYFETMTDGEGYYEIELPIGAYNVTAYANGESLTQEVFIGVAEQIELNFLLGDWNGPWEPYAQLSLGGYHTTIPGGEVAVPLYLSSNDFVGGVQFTIATNEPGLNLLAIESIDPCFSANFNMIDDLQSIGIIFSLEGCTYPPEEMLEIATMVFNISPYITVGTELELFFNNTIVSDSIGNEIPSYGEGAIIMLGEKGDVNADGEINVLDIVMIVNFALYVESPNDLEFWASDTNNDGAINVLDVVQLVNIILED